MNDRQPERRGLGRGLSALMSDVNIDVGPRGDARPRRPDERLPIEKIAPNPDQPRRDFPAEALESLAASIRAKGVIQPLIVRPDPGAAGQYQIVAGERRWRAAQMAQLHDVPVLIRDLSDTEVLEVAIIENIQRADLNPVEEAMGYRQLMDRFGHTQEKLAEALSKSRSYIANLLRLLNLPDEVLALLREGKLSAGHARALITTQNPAELARRVVAGDLSVRQTEAMAKPKPARSPNARAKDADTAALEQDLCASLGMKVQIDHPPGGLAGAVVIRYASLEQLDDLCRMLTATAPGAAR